METTWQPEWWDDSHRTAWERVQEALRRDWEQTKFDLNVGDGEMLNQDAGDTIRQAAGAEPIPPRHERNPLKIREGWERAELPVRYGYAAFQKFGGQYPTWGPGVEDTLQKGWESGLTVGQQAWAQAREQVKYGYEYQAAAGRAAKPPA